MHHVHQPGPTAARISTAFPMVMSIDRSKSLQHPSCKLRLLKIRTKDSISHPIPSNHTPEIPPENDAPLCSTCSSLDLHAILHDGVPREHAIPIGNLTDILNKSNQCGLCNLIAIVIRRAWNLDKLPDIDISDITCALHTMECGYPNIPSYISPALMNICHRLHIQTFDRPRDVTAAMVAARSNLLLEIQLLGEDASKVGRTKELHGRRVGQNVDIALLKRWIHICEHEHGELCETVWWRGTGDVLPKSVRVVDVTRMAVVRAPPSCRFVALSYLWGGTGEEYWTTRANIKQRRAQGGLDVSVLPSTILDTIQLVRQLGERYLWIDALCIVQDDPKDKTVQIGVMELIYGSSAFTIFAAGGTSAHDPLPGIRPGTRDPKQQIAKIQGLHLAVPLILPCEAIASSAWDTRGWTYQEVMLSRRRIFLTPHHVHFECGKDIWSEDVIAERINLPWASHPLKYGGTGSFTFARAPLQGTSSAYMSHYMSIIGKYTRRRLTMESDIVNAVTALINAMAKGFKLAGGNPGRAFRFGMPIVDLELALVWQPTPNASCVRRATGDGNMTLWPSWSWAAWRGAVQYSEVSLFVDAQNGGVSPCITQSLVEQWHMVDGDGQLVPQDVRRTGRMAGSVEEANSSPYIIPKGDIDTQTLITENAPLQPGTLVFRTRSAHFNVTKADDVAGADPKANYATYSILSDVPRPSTLVGRVILPRSTHSPTSCEFIVLFRTNQTKGLYDEDTLGKRYFGCMLYVMAVQKMQDEKRMERVGVGVIFEHAWRNSTGEQKVVLLG
ncbi:heterokaryon incompatibility protein-domain-containing protein [Suillus discolor]|uniref:Heterokaryon incompatibility protein-domain-containing protein n=1 Tax=Suillus discolor TaxID=1912936 RepID=A0A9P7FJA2_9AGAM|nr:heterokaryon incompatibility protein-domain-containing protein [Suillus discolor]KAG2120525.1 heterokaryon incompatibility protein-domain-containing protein [Suillus discolor]